MSEYPSASMYRDEEEKKSVEGMEPQSMQEIGNMLAYCRRGSMLLERVQ